MYLELYQPYAGFLDSELEKMRDPSMSHSLLKYQMDTAILAF